MIPSTRRVKIGVTMFELDIDDTIKPKAVYPTGGQGVPRGKVCTSDFSTGLDLQRLVSWKAAREEWQHKVEEEATVATFAKAATDSTGFPLGVSCDLPPSCS